MYNTGLRRLPIEPGSFIANRHLLSSDERDRYIIERLRAAEEPVSGETLAEELGISRVACWKRIGVLQAWGYGIESSRRGYALVRDDGLAAWDLPAPGPVLLFDEAGSTMDEARKAAEAGAPSGTLVLALRQSAGRGKAGRSWLSPAGGLYASVVLRSPLPPGRGWCLALETARALSDLLAAAGLPRPRFRWPNDLMYGEAKAGGILVEMGGGVDMADWYAVGVGLNMAPLAVPGRQAASLAELSDAPPRRATLAAALATELRTWAAAPAIDPSRWSSLLPESPARASALMWDGSKREFTVHGFDSRGGLAVSDSRGAAGEVQGVAPEMQGVAPEMQGVAPGDCVKINWQGEPS